MFRLLQRALSANRRHRVRRPVNYLIPVALSLLLVLFSASQTVPRVLDLVSLVGRGHDTETIQLEQDDIRWMSFDHNGRTFHFNRWQMIPSPGKRYQVHYTPYSRSVLLLEEITDVGTVLP